MTESDGPVAGEPSRPAVLASGDGGVPAPSRGFDRVLASRADVAAVDME
jgi:hypothetical protein